MNAITETQPHGSLIARGRPERSVVGRLSIVRTVRSDQPNLRRRAEVHAVRIVARRTVLRWGLLDSPHAWSRNHERHRVTNIRACGRGIARQTSHFSLGV